MSMQAMVHEMRDRFLVALVFTIPIVVWSPVGETLQTMPLGTANASCSTSPAPSFASSHGRRGGSTPRET